MDTSIPRKLARTRNRIGGKQKKIARSRSKIAALEKYIKRLESECKADAALCAEYESRVADRDKIGLVRAAKVTGGLSKYRPTRLKQVLVQVCEEQSVAIPAWIKDICEKDVHGSKIDQMIDKFVLSKTGLISTVPESFKPFVGDRVRALMSNAKPKASAEGEDVLSEKSEDLWDLHPDWDFEKALAVAARARQEFGAIAIEVGDRNAIIHSSRCNYVSDGIWITDVPATVVARFRSGEIVALSPSREKAGAKIRSSIDRKKSRSLSAIENENRLMEAVAIFATPGAVAHGAAFGLFETGRRFSTNWFSDHRKLISSYYARIGSAGAFGDLIANPESFAQIHAPGAPKIVQGSQFWARKNTEREFFKKKRPEDLIDEARHSLIDTSLRSSLVSMPKNKVNYIDLGAWQTILPASNTVFNVSGVITKGFQIEALDAAEIQVMQGSNPIAITIGLVTWISADGVHREAPLFLAMASFEPEAVTVSRISSFHVNVAWLRRLGVEYPKLESLDILGEFPMGDEAAKVFSVIAAKINAASDAKPIVSISDQSYVGVFDSARSVLERRLNMRAFPEIAENPIVRMLAQGAEHQISYAQYTPQGGRSRPDEVQTLAVRASLGGSSFILEGPPGTGKTQTIFEMVLALSAAGKRVLVTAAMPGAIEVVGRRMRGALRFGISSLRPGQIDIGGPTKKVDARAAKFEVLIGTPLAITKDLAADDRFDVIIFDESSQMRMSHAIAVAGHATQIIVVGDSRQLQPRDDEPGAVAEQSLLMRARMAGLPSITLQEHYRSQHPSLITWSNLYSYDSKLRPRLGPLLYGEAGFSVVYVAPSRRVIRDATFVNVEEAHRVAEECLRLAREGRHSVGVAAMTQAQRDLIREVVEERLSKAGISAATAAEDNRFFSKTEPFFIRTAGAVQGEERDVVLISLGVGPDKDGGISQNLGVLSRADGLALCNVALSRARLKTTVYSSIVPGDIDVVAMTPAMFLIASILRMGAVIGALENPKSRQSDIDPKTVDANFAWKIDRLEIDGENCYGVLIPAIPERYAFAIVSRDPYKPHPLTDKLEAGGWIVCGTSPQFLSDPRQVVIFARNQISRLSL